MHWCARRSNDVDNAATLAHLAWPHELGSSYADTDQFDPAKSQAISQRIAIVGLVGDHAHIAEVTGSHA